MATIGLSTISIFAVILAYTIMAIGNFIGKHTEKEKKHGLGTWVMFLFLTLIETLPFVSSFPQSLALNLYSTFLEIVFLAFSWFLFYQVYKWRKIGIKLVLLIPIFYLLIAWGPFFIKTASTTPVTIEQLKISFYLMLKICLTWAIFVGSKEKFLE